jgi:hypothetical protein
VFIDDFGPGVQKNGPMPVTLKPLCAQLRMSSTTGKTGD